MLGQEFLQCGNASYMRKQALRIARQHVLCSLRCPNFLVVIVYQVIIILVSMLECCQLKRVRRMVSHKIHLSLTVQGMQQEFYRCALEAVIVLILPRAPSHHCISCSLRVQFLHQGKWSSTLSATYEQ